MASAGGITTVTLTPTHATAIQQSTQDPCIFGNAPCGQNNDSIGDGAGNDFPWERTPVSSEDGGAGGPLVAGNLLDDTTWGNGPGEQNDYDGSRILVSRLISVLSGNSLVVGYDINQTGDDAITLTQFTLQIFSAANALLDTWAMAAPFVVPVANNGTGWSDAVLSFPGLNLASYAAGAYAVFTTSWTGNTDGQENYFIDSATPGPPNVPEPASIFLIGSGLVGAAGAIRRRRAAAAASK